MGREPRTKNQAPRLTATDKSLFSQVCAVVAESGQVGQDVWLFGVNCPSKSLPESYRKWTEILSTLPPRVYQKGDGFGSAPSESFKPR